MIAHTAAGATLAQLPGAVVGAKSYDTSNVLAALWAARRAVAVIPPEPNRLDQRAYARNLQAERNKIERLFGRLTAARGFGTR